MRRSCVMLAPLMLAIFSPGCIQAQKPANADKTPQTAPPSATTPPPTGTTASPPGAPAQAAGNGPTVTPQSVLAVDASTYIIGAQDGLQVSVWQNPTLSGVFPVRPDGMITLALVGDIQAAGLTPMELGTNITEKLKKFVQDPIVNVTVTAVNSKVIYVVGEVGKPGPMGMTPGMTALQAIATAGGLSAFAHSKNIYVLRGKQQQHIPFDYKKALKGDLKQMIPLQPGDTIVVP